MASVERARSAFHDANYQLSVSLYEECLAVMEPSTEMYLDYADALVQCGRLLDSLNVYSLCSRYTLLSSDRLGHVITSFTELLTSAGMPKGGDCGLGCAVCEGVLIQPVTLRCGHTFCTGCVVRDHDRACRECGARIVPGTALETNVLIKKVVERWFHQEIRAARLREEGNRLCLGNKFEEALTKYNAALDIVPSHLVHSNRSHTLYRLNRLQAALDDAEAAIKLRPHWIKGHYRRGVVMSAMGQHEEAFVSFALCVALDTNGETMRNDLTRTLKKLLVPSSPSRRLCVKSRWSSPYFSPAHFLPTVNSSDCEDNSSGEDDYQIQKKTMPKVQANRRLHKIFDRILQEVNRLKKLEWKPVLLTIDPKAVDSTDFDCILCCRTLWQAVTTPCGHSYCAMCLERCLDYSSSCPLCMTSLTSFVGNNTKSVTRWLQDALQLALPEAYNSRLLSHRQELEEIERSPEVPVFVCTTAFPAVTCPLFIYEPRYRGMIRRCVESGNRQFAISACVQQGKNTKRYADYGTMLKIEDWVLLPDGCSILTTVGLRRFQVLSRSEKDGYDTAQIKFLVDVPIHEQHLKEMEVLHERVLVKGHQWLAKMPAALQDEIYRTLGQIPEVEADWWSLDDGPAWLWWLLAILPLSKTLQIAILSITSLGKRLKAIEKTLDHLAVNVEATAPLGGLTETTAPAVS